MLVEHLVQVQDTHQLQNVNKLLQLGDGNTNTWHLSNMYTTITMLNQQMEVRDHNRFHNMVLNM